MGYGAGWNKEVERDHVPVWTRARVQVRSIWLYLENLTLILNYILCISNTPVGQTLHSIIAVSPTWDRLGCYARIFIIPRSRYQPATPATCYLLQPGCAETLPTIRDTEALKKASEKRECDAVMAEMAAAAEVRRIHISLASKSITQEASIKPESVRLRSAQTVQV